MIEKKHPPRPTMNDPAVIARAAEILADKLFVTGCSLWEKALPVLRKVLEETELDGYEMARELDDKGFEVNAETVEILADQGRPSLRAAHREATEAWVKALGLQPARPQSGTIDLPTAEGKNSEKWLIVSVDAKLGQYLVTLNAADWRRSSVRLLNFEDVDVTSGMAA